jgi:hypothetical protein
VNRLSRGAVVILGQPYFLAQNHHFFGRRDAQLNAPGAGLEDLDLDITRDENGFSGAPADYEHGDTWGTGGNGWEQP